MNGYVDYVDNLNENLKKLLATSNIINYIPWRAVWKPNSVSTPCRIVFDASHPTDSGFSLNDILAKGSNNMNRLLEIIIRWSTHQTAFHTDISKMYNSVQLKEHHWCLQRYIWIPEQDSNKLPKEKVIKTLIYGVNHQAIKLNMLSGRLLICKSNLSQMHIRQQPEISMLMIVYLEINHLTLHSVELII